jgi:hypothetical protein
MELLKSFLEIMLFLLCLAGLVILIAKCEHDSSPMVDGRRVGVGYECHDNVLYLVSGSGMGRSIAPSFNSDTGKIIKCSR